MDDIIDRQPEEAVNLPHPFGVAFGQIVVDGNDVDAFAFQRVQISGKRGDQGFAFTGFHFGNHAFMQHNPADQLNIVMALAESAFGGLAYDGKSFGQQIVKRFAVFQALFKLFGFCF